MFDDQAPAEFEERLTRPIDELIQDGSPGWVSDRAVDVHMSGVGFAGGGLTICKRVLARQL